MKSLFLFQRADSGIPLQPDFRSYAGEEDSLNRQQYGGSVGPNPKGKTFFLRFL